MRALPLLCCLLLVSVSASAQNVYKSKDAQGNTVYSSTPPAGKSEMRRMENRDPNTPQAKAAPAESADCTASRKNLALLNGQGEVMYDTDGDGTPDTPLNAEQRKAQVGMAEAGVKAYCPPAA